MPEDSSILSEWKKEPRTSLWCRPLGPALVTVLRDDFVQTYERELPAVVQGVRDDFDACIAHLHFPLRHRRIVRTTNLLERLFLEERRRTKIIPHAFGERPVLKLMYGAVSRAAGFELGSGIYVTTMFPEESAAILRPLLQ